MFLQLGHTKLDVYVVSRRFLVECYNITKKFPPDERYILGSQIKRAALSVLLNLAEGASRKSPRERRRFYTISRSSLVEIDGALDAAIDLKYVQKEDLQEVGSLLIRVFQMLTKMI